MKIEDDINIIKKMLNSTVQFSDQEWNVMKKHLHHINYKKGDIILQKGEVENYIYFISKGIIRFFFFSDSHQDHTLGFRSGPTGFSAYTSFISRKPSKVSSQAMSNVSLFRVSFDELEKLYTELRITEVLSRKFLEFAYIEREEKEFNLLSLSATDFYKYILTKHHEISVKVPQKHIASYMGIAPESLSRIKNELKKK